MEMSPEEFNFPFKPYDIQVQFVRSLYHAIDSQKLAVFESPTGTGKSLSIICGALTWLKNYENKLEEQFKENQHRLEQLQNDLKLADDWFTSQTTSQEELEKLQKRRLLFELFKQKQKVYKSYKSNSTKTLEYFKNTTKDGEDSTSEDLCLLDEYHSDEESQSNESKHEDELDNVLIKIIYSSRTHSQMSQFIHEMKKTVFNNDVRLVSLGSRQFTCINDSVKKLKNNTLMNERCTELQKSSTKNSESNEESTTKKRKTNKAKACPYFNVSNIKGLQSYILGNLGDIEDITKIGVKIGACPYYGMRFAIQDAEVIVVPYNTLLHRGTREACGISLNNSVVIIDEAHNLLDSISSIHSSLTYFQQLAHSYSQVEQYISKYGSRLSPKNFYYIRQLTRFIKVLVTFLKDPSLKPKSGVAEKCYSLAEFLILLKVDNINLFKLINYCHKSRIAQKLQSFSMLFEGSLAAISPQDVNSDSQSRCPLLGVIELLKAMTYAEDHCRIICSFSAEPNKSYIKVLSLSPAHHFADIISQSRSVILAGGTMQPVSEFRDYLFGACGAELSRFHSFSCDHIVSDRQVFPAILARGPTGVQLEFSFHRRTDEDMILELGRVIVNVSQIIRGGVIVFFPSYDYENLIYQNFLQGSVIKRIEARKLVVREPRSSDNPGQVLKQYADAVRAGMNRDPRGGAVLFSVVGGKLSEGINFSDDLARCVVVVGLPYSNPNSQELREKMTYLNANYPPSGGMTAGQLYYENLCMKAVNQSIGRAIRHQHDFAAMLMLDSRYNRPLIRSSFPNWLVNRLRVYDKFGVMFSELRKFFVDMQSM